MDLVRNFRVVPPEVYRREAESGGDLYLGANYTWLFEIEAWPGSAPVQAVLKGHGFPPNCRWTARLILADGSAEITGTGLGPRLWEGEDCQPLRTPADDGGFVMSTTARRVAELFARSAVHSVVESVSYQQFVVGPEGEFEEGDSGYEVDPQAVAPTEVHNTADQFGTFEADGDGEFSSEAEDIGRGGEEVTRYLQILDLDGENLATFSDWGERPYPLLQAESFPAALQIMASRGFYLFSFWEESEAVRALVKDKGFGHLISPIPEFGRLVLESRDPWELLVLQDLLLSSDLEGSERTFLPTDRQGAPIELPFDVVEVETDYGFAVQLLRQDPVAVKARLLR